MKSRDTFRLNVRERMTNQGLRVKDLADMVGLSPSYLSLVLSGERVNLSDQHKDAIALALGTSVADLYTERPTGTAEVPGPHGGAEDTRVDTAFILRRARDVTPFEDFLRVLNVTDTRLLQAYYRELNSISDDDVRKFGGMLRNVLTSWQAASSQNKSGEVLAPNGASRPEAAVLEPDHRTLLWLISYISALTGEASLNALSAALSWTLEKIHMALEPLLLAGVVAVVSPTAAEPGGEVAVKAAEDVRPEPLAPWIPAGVRQSALLAFARTLEARPDAEPEDLARVFLEAGDLHKAREWYVGAAVRAVDSELWRIAKNHLLVVSSLDTVLSTPGEERASTAQMLVTTCQNLGETDEALAYQERNLVFWEKAGSPGDVVRGSLSAASMLARRREWERAGAHLQKALAMSSGDYSAQARVRTGIAAVHAERGHIQRARDEYERALDLAGKAQEQGLMAHALLGLGRMALWRQDYQRCAQYLNRALSLSEKRDTAMEVLSRLELGKLRFTESSYVLARDHLEKAVRAAAGIGNAESENAAKAWLSRTIGRGAEPAGLTVKRDLAAAAKAHFTRTGEPQGMVVSLLASAEADAAAGDHLQAAATFGEAVRGGRDSENPALEALACQAYSEYLQEQDTALAQVMLERSRWARSKLH